MHVHRTYKYVLSLRGRGMSEISASYTNPNPLLSLSLYLTIVSKLQHSQTCIT